MSLINLHIITEGYTELLFVKNVLYTFLLDKGINATPRCILTGERQRGGLTSYNKARNEIICWLKASSSNDSRFTTMFDLYRLPANFPEYDRAKKISDPYQRVMFLEMAMKDDINDWRFIPYIQLHEYEALLFAEPDKLMLQYPDRKTEIDELVLVRDSSKDKNPELINDGEDTSPSKRIKKILPMYAKTTDGPLVAKAIGIESLKQKCRHFREWLESLETLSRKRQINK